MPQNRGSEGHTILNNFSLCCIAALLPLSSLPLTLHIAQLYGCAPSLVGPIQTNYCWNGQKDQKKASKVGGGHWNRVLGWKFVHRGGKWEWLICDAKTAHIWKLEANMNTCFGPCNKFILSTMMYLTWKGRPEQLYRPEWTLFCPWEQLPWPERE